MCNEEDTSPNRAYLATCLRHYAQIQLDCWTSDTLRTSVCVKTLFSMKNNPPTPFKSKNKIKILLNLGFSHSQTLPEIYKCIKHTKK